MIKLQVSLHSGAVEEVEVNEYNAADLAEKLNDSSVYVIALGDQVFSRIDIRHVKKVDS